MRRLNERFLRENFRFGMGWGSCWSRSHKFENEFFGVEGHAPRLESYQKIHSYTFISRHSRNMSNPICVYDATIKKVDRAKVEAFLIKHCKKWCYQEEKSASGFEHYQCRFSLKVKERIRPVIMKMQFAGLETDVSPTSNANCENMFYVMKDKTRVAGPWTEDDIMPDREIVEMKLWPYQATVEEMITKPPEPRIINVIYDPHTNNGKSWLKQYLRYRKLACVMPCEHKWADIAAIALAKGQQQAYIIDVPKELKGKRLSELWSGVESLKDGYVYDKRYAFKDAQYKRAHLWVFTNTFPPLKADSRLKIWMIDHNKILVPWSKEREINLDKFHKFTRTSTAVQNTPEETPLWEPQAAAREAPLIQAASVLRSRVSEYTLGLGPTGPASPTMVEYKEEGAGPGGPVAPLGVLELDHMLELVAGPVGRLVGVSGEQNAALNDIGNSASIADVVDDLHLLV